VRPAALAGRGRLQLMSSGSPAPLKQTPLHATHRAHGARMVEFGGWDMPVQYPAGTVTEHLRTRTHAGLFDVSHMGEIDVRGPDAIPFVNRVASNDASKLVDGQAHYSALTNEKGGVVDDLLVYRFDQDKLLLVVNASTTDKDWDWITSHKGDENITLTNASADYCQIAVQGPLDLRHLIEWLAQDGMISAEGALAIACKRSPSFASAFPIMLAPLSMLEITKAVGASRPPYPHSKAIATKRVPSPPGGRFGWIFIN